jgi:hypothetical protein
MAPLYPDVQQIVDDVTNALQAAVLIAEHLQRTSTATVEDADAVIRNLRRVTDGLERLRRTGGAL